MNRFLSVVFSVDLLEYSYKASSSMFKVSQRFKKFHLDNVMYRETFFGTIRLGSRMPKSNTYSHFPFPRGVDILSLCFTQR